MITVSGIQNFLATNRSPLRPIRSSAVPMILAPLSTRFFKSTGSFRRNKPRKCALRQLKITAKRPITDRVLDFGRYKGQMIGTVPSKYLKWVSINVVSGDSVIWADIAREVLRDPVYQDRIEWEYALRVLEGNNIRNGGEDFDAVSQLEEIAERFNWEKFGTPGWSKVRFDLIGTSLSGRIPKKGSSESSPTDAGGALEEEKRASKKKKSNEIFSDSERRRMERRERAKLKRSQVDWRREKLGIAGKSRDSSVNGNVGITGKSRGSSVNVNVDGDNSTLSKTHGSDQEDEKQEEVKSVFPGREALWKKAINSRRRSF